MQMMNVQALGVVRKLAHRAQVFIYCSYPGSLLRHVHNEYSDLTKWAQGGNAEDTSRTK